VSNTPTLILLQLVILLPFAMGLFIKRRVQAPGGFTRRLVNLNLIFIEPPLIFWSIWGLPLDLKLLQLPLAGVALVLTGMGLGAVAVRFMRLEVKTASTFLICSALANHGFTLGGSLCFFLFGERGLAYSIIFISYFIPFVFMVIFPYARARSASVSATPTPLYEYVFNLQNMPLLAVIAGLSMNLLAGARPRIAFPVEFFLVVSIAVYYFTLGINFEPAELRSGLLPQIWLCTIKFTLVPAAAFLVLCVFQIEPGIRSVILIQSFMPAAVYSVVVPVLFDLDKGMASSLFVINTVVFMALVLPVLWFARGLLFGL